MAYYSLVASLPHLQIGDEPPFSTEEYIDNCAQWITDYELKILQRVVLKQETDLAHCQLCQAWHSIETQIRNTAARLRGHKLGVDVKEYIQSHDGFSGEVEALVTDAFTRNDPLEIEEELDRARWKLADDLIGLKSFEFEKILAYGIQLKIVERWDRMDVHVGKEKLEAVITANTEQKDEKQDESE